MKKTIKTMLTAAVFAASIGSATNATINGNAGYTPEASDFQGAYGPPEWYTETTKTTETTQTTIPTETWNPETTTPTLVYGPPFWYTTTETKSDTTTTTTQSQLQPQPTETWNPETILPIAEYGPPPANGDIDGDGRTDVFDVIKLRKMITEKGAPSPVENYEEFNGDVNRDGQVGIADLVMLQNYILGKIDNFKERLPEPEMTTTNIPVPVYGPPEWFTTTKRTETTTTAPVPIETETNIPEPVYGPPEWFEK